MNTISRTSESHSAMPGFTSGSNPGALPIGAAYPWLAPLAGYSDLPFRLLCRELGAAAACTEMVSAKGLVLGQGRRNNATNDLLATYPPLEPPVSGAARDAQYPYQASPDSALGRVAPDSPLIVQLFGAEAPIMEEAVHILAERGYRWFDLNMGCSVPKVGKSGSGSAMLQDPENALRVAERMVKAAGKGRVGFKLRLGRAEGEEVYLSLGKALAETGAGWLTLHPRYAKQKFTGTANWAAVRPLVEAVSVPVMVSGDLFSPADGKKALEASGAAGVMFARGAMHNPAIFGQFVSMLHDGPARGDCSRFADGAVLEKVIRRHADLIRAFYPARANRQGVDSGLLKMRTFVPRYVKECSGARFLRRSMASCRTWREMEVLLGEFFGNADNLRFGSGEEDAA